jgi:hypothetical protein
MPPLDAAAGANDWVTAPAPTTAATSAAGSSAGNDDWITAPPTSQSASTGSQQPSAFGAVIDRLVSPAQADVPTITVHPTPQGAPPPAADGSAPNPLLAALAPPTAPAAAVDTVAARVGAALVAGWKDTPDLLTPQAQDWLANAERNNPRPNLQDVLTVGHAALAAGNAVFRGGL